jgi:hypothetical protein
MNESKRPAGPRPATGAKPWPGDDFPSWISPMLVKELRQGVQSGAFAWTFVLLQVAMFVLMTFWLLERSTNDSIQLNTNRLFHGWFWVVFGLAAVLVLPLRAAGSMAAERVGNTLDLLRLTRLSSMQIVTGKWLAIMAQVLLLSTAVLPYVVLQYFFGGLDIVSDLFAFVSVLLAASVVTAASVSTAGQPAWSRGVFVVLAMIFFGNVTAGAVSFFGLGATDLWSTLPAIAIVAGLLTAVFLVYSAAAIAPPAENHSLRARLLAVAAVVLCLLATRLFGPVSAAFVITIAITIVAGIAIAELMQEPSELVGLHAPFARLGIVGQAAAALFTPGWATAVYFSLAMAATLVVGFLPRSSGISSMTGSRIQLDVALAIAAILFPLPLMLRFPQAFRKTVFILVQSVSIVVFLFLQSPFGRSETPAAQIFSILARCLPLTSLLDMVTSGSKADRAMIAVPLIVTGIAIATVVPRAWRELSATAARVRQAGRRAAHVRGSRSTTA